MEVTSLVVYAVFVILIMLTVSSVQLLTGLPFLVASLIGLPLALAIGLGCVWLLAKLGG